MLDLSQNYIIFTKNIKVDEPLSSMIFRNPEVMVDYYEELLAKTLIERAHQRDLTISEENQDKIFPYIKYIIEWLRKGDFYTAPASTKYHDACNGGLLAHTLKVYNELISLRIIPKFSIVSEKQWWNAVFVVLVHDWCKIGRYESYLKNVKQDNGEWVKVRAYKYVEDSIGRLGHGTQSLVMAMQLCNSKYTSLTFEEMASIRWHMDNWDMSNYDVDDLCKCNEKIPMVRMVQFADQLAITTY